MGTIWLMQQGEGGPTTSHSKQDNGERLHTF